MVLSKNDVLLFYCFQLRFAKKGLTPCAQTVHEGSINTNPIRRRRKSTVPDVDVVRARLNRGLRFVLVSIPFAHAINRDFMSFKNLKFSAENFDIFLIFAQNIDCGYTLEPPR